MKLTIEQLKRIVRESIREQSAQGAGVNTAVAPAAGSVKKEQAGGILGKLGKLSTAPLDREKKSPGGKKAVYRISSGGITMGYGVGTSAPEAIANFLVTKGRASSEEAAMGQVHHYGAEIMSNGSIRKELGELETELERAQELMDQLYEAHAESKDNSW